MMKKLLFILFATILFSNLNAQCTVATFSYSQGFEAFNGVMPTCWTTPSPSNVMSINSGGGAGGTAGYLDVECLDAATRYFVMPKVVNAKGILNLKGKRVISNNSTRMEVGVMTNPSVASTFSVISSVFLGVTNYSAYSINLSSYAGTGQYIAVRISPMNVGAGVRAYLDDINYVSYCLSSSVTAIAQNYTVQLSNSGTAAITTANINNGSTSGCGSPTLSLSQTNFNCSHIGINTVTLTATDNASNTAVATASITVLPAINDEILSSLQSTICPGNSTTITTGSSVNGIKYYLRDDATNTIVAGPTIGTGSALAFNTGTLVTNKTYNVFAETSNSSALDFDGVNDVVNTSISTPATNSLTLEAWIYPRATTVKRIITKFKNNATLAGEYILDTYNPTNNGRGVRFYVEGAGNVTHTISVANALTLNAWNHVATTFNNGAVKLYVNGIEVATNTAPFTSIPSNTATVCFGEDATIGALEHFDGRMDDIRIWNTARTQAEIAANMNNCLVGNEIGLTNYFKISEGIGTTITDLVSLTTGTMSGMDANDWVIGQVDCGGTVCSFEMSQLITINVNQTPTITVNSGSICAGNSFTLSPSGANTYTIQGGSAIKTPTANATYTVIGSSSAGCISSTFASSSVTVNTTPTIAVNSSSICSGDSFTITPSGANSYTIQGGGSIKTPTANTSYTVIGTSSLGCVSNTFATSSVTVNSVPIIAVNSGSICAGNTFTIMPSGASTYTIQGGNNIVNPTTHASYTVTGTSANGCSSSTFATSNVSVNVTPTITVNNGTVCAGNNFTITPSGANTYTIQGGSAIKTPIANASYTVIGTSSEGCVSSTFAISNVTVNALPTINTTTSNTLICVGETASLTVSGTSTSYTWNTSATGTSISVSPTVTTTYTVIGTDVNGCENNSVLAQSVSLCTGINQITNNNSMTLFPNPSASSITIQTIEEIKEIYIFNTLGDLVRTEKSPTFSVENLSSGIYIIHVKTEKGINTLRFIRE